MTRAALRRSPGGVAVPCVDFGIGGVRLHRCNYRDADGRDLNRASVEAATIAHVSDKKALPVRMNSLVTLFRNRRA